MKTLLRRMKAFLSLIRRLCYRLVCWINYPTPRERMWHMFYMGKLQGQQEALKTLPITQVQPRQQVTEPLHLPPGVWSKRYFEMHPEHRAAVPSPLRTVQLQPLDPPDWLIGTNDPTAKVPAIKKQAYQEYHQRRHGG